MKATFNKAEARRESAKKIDWMLSKEFFEAVYEVGKSDGLPVEIEEEVESSQREALFEMCQEFCSAWRATMEGIRKGVAAALTSWAAVIEPKMRERLANLEKSAKPTLDPRALDEMESVVGLIDSVARSGGLGVRENLVKAARLIESHKPPAAP